jgi:hypothetical protein
VRQPAPSCGIDAGHVVNRLPATDRLGRYTALREWLLSRFAHSSPMERHMPQGGRLFAWLEPRHGRGFEAVLVGGNAQRQIATIMQVSGAAAAGTVNNAFQSLTAYRLIEHRHGTNMLLPDHRIVRIDGRVTKADGCQLVLP